MADTSVFNRTYNSFSGVDIKACIGSKVLMELQAISYNVSREKAPLYTMGGADPRSFSRGKRGIAGTLITVVFDRHALLGTLGFMNPNIAQQTKFLSDTDDIHPDIGATDVFSTSVQNAGGTTVTGEALVAESELTNKVDDDQMAVAPWFADQIPPFDITLAAANEYGGLAVMRVYGAELLNEGSGVSIDDMMSEMQHTYIARTMMPWKSLGASTKLNPTNP